jgi:hypothetical protein
MLEADFYRKTLREDRQRSYSIIADAIVRYFAPNSVADFGCGAGWLMFYLLGRGVRDLYGCEPACARIHIIHPSVLPCIADVSLTSRIDLRRTFDLGVCLEVAEHIDQRFSSILVDNICRHARTIMFSAATPGQGGFGHVNEQPFPYWEKRFNKHHFSLDVGLTERLRRHLRARKVQRWYHRNIRILRNLGGVVS